MTFEELASEVTLDASDFSGGADEAAGASEDLGGATDDLEQQLFDLEPAGVAAGGALAGIGTAAGDILGDTQDMRESLGRTATSMGISSEAANTLARDVSNVTFPIDDATSTLDALARQGVTSEEQMKDVATSADMIADATGTTATKVAENAVPALKAMGQEAGDLGEHMDTFTFLARNSQMSVEDFSRLVQKAAPEIEEMGLSVDDTATFMSALEEKGLDSRTAMSEFRQAADKAEGDQEKLKEELGLTSDELDAQRDALNNAKGSTEEFSEAANESLTTTDEIAHALDEAKLAAADMLGPVDAIAPAMQTAGIAMMAMSTINFSAVVPSLVAVATAAAPVVIPLLAIAAAAGALYVAFDRNLFGIKDIAKDVFAALKQGLQPVIGAIREFVDIVKTALGGDVDEALSRLKTLFSDVISGIKTFLLEDAPPMIVAGLKAVARAGVDVLKSLKTRIIGPEGIIPTAISAVVEYLSSIGVDDIKAAFKAIGKGIRTVVLGLVDGALSLKSLFGKAIGAVATYLKEDAKGDLVTAIKAVGGAVVDGAKVTLAALTPPDGVITQIIGDITSYLVNDAPGDLKAAAETAIDAVMAAFEGLYDGLIGKSLIPNMVGDIVSYLKNDAASDLAQAATAMAEAIWDNFKRGFNTLVPSSIGINESIGLPSATVMGQTIGGGTLPINVDVPLPQLAGGGLIEETGVAVVHEGETVVPSGEGGGKSVTVNGDIVLQSGTDSPDRFAKDFVDYTEELL